MAEKAGSRGGGLGLIELESLEEVNREATNCLGTEVVEYVS